MRTLPEEPADNAATQIGCNIKRTSVSPRQQSANEHQGRHPNIVTLSASSSGGAWVAIEPAKRATIREDKNEVIEIPARSHGRKLVKKKRAKTEDPRPKNSVGEFIGATRSEEQEVSEKSWLKPNEKKKKGEI